MQSPMDVNIRLAKALGLDVANLVWFRLDVRTNDFPKVTATYWVRSGEILEQISRTFELRNVEPHQEAA